MLAATPAPARARAGVLRVRLAATAAVARQELNGVRAAAGTRLEAIDRALGVPGARTARGLELALLDPAAGAPAVGNLRLWRAGLTARAGTLRQVEREVATDLAGREGRLRDRLVLLAVILVASLAAVLLVVMGPLGLLDGPDRGHRRQRRRRLPDRGRRPRPRHDRRGSWPGPTSA